MAAAYAAPVSLLSTIDNILNHPRICTSLDKEQIESLGEKVGFLLDFIESYTSYGGSKKTRGLEREITSAAHAAEDAIESHVVDQILSGSILHEEISFDFLLDLQQEMKDIKKKVLKAQGKIQSKYESSRLQNVMKDMDSVKNKIMEVEDVIGSYLVDDILVGKSTIKSRTFLIDLQKIVEDMDSIKKKVIKVKKKGRLDDRRPTHSIPAVSSIRLTTGKTTMVGFDGYLVQLLEELTDQQSDRRIIPIIGMGGIGKTTLAINAYENYLPCNTLMFVLGLLYLKNTM